MDQFIWQSYQNYQFQMYTVLDHYNPYSTNSEQQWQGLRSSKFGRTKAFLPKQDMITTGFNYPSQQSARGRRHFEQRTSPQRQFRSIVRIIPKIDHWHPRESRKKVQHMSFTQSLPRRERGHDLPEFPLTQRDTAGIRTFYNSRIREDNMKQYSVEDRMQRKHRIDQHQLRRTFFMKEKQEKEKYCL